MIENMFSTLSRFIIIIIIFNFKKIKSFYLSKGQLHPRFDVKATFQDLSSYLK